MLNYWNLLKHKSTLHQLFPDMPTLWHVFSSLMLGSPGHIKKHFLKFMACNHFSHVPFLTSALFDMSFYQHLKLYTKNDVNNNALVRKGTQQELVACQWSINFIILLDMYSFFIIVFGCHKIKTQVLILNKLY